MKNYIITIARGFGTGGKEIASSLADELGIECYESRILTLASEYSGYDEKRFVAVDEKLRSSSLSLLPRSFITKPMTDTFVSDDQLFSCQAEIIKHLAETESCIIVGKCADFILKDYKNVISIYIEAPRPYCVERVIEQMGVSEKEANNIISSTDKYRADYYKHYTNGNYWTNPTNYDFTVNVGRTGAEMCKNLILQYLHMNFKIENNSIL